MSSSQTSAIGTSNESDSELSDPPSDLDIYALELEPDLDACIHRMTINGPVSTKSSRMGNAQSTLKRPRSLHHDNDGDVAMTDPSEDDDAQDDESREYKRFRLMSAQHSWLESVPNEILNQIAFYVNNDRDFMNLASSSPLLAQSLIPADSAIWKKRFLSLYDVPLVDEHVQYAVAYQMRRFVLSHFIDFRKHNDERLRIQMGNLRDMVIETYLPEKAHLPAPTTSRNLAAFESPQNSPWMLKFLSTALFPGATRKAKFGQPQPFFDALQVCLSHLLLSPASKMAHQVDSSRANYNLVLVYNWNEAFSTVYRRVQVLKEEEPKKEPDPRTKRRSMRSRKSRKSPRLKDRRSAAPEPPEFKLELDMHTLLHIRNFWHRHLIDSTKGFSDAKSRWMGEDTYSKMANKLLQMGITPKKWDKPLKSEPSPVASEWHGHYSCIHPWPKTVRDLEERQTCAEDWNSVDPLKLEFSTSQSNIQDGFWPPIFSSIPAFDITIPDLDAESSNCTVIQGLASFIDLSSGITNKRKSTGKQPALTTPKLPKYHPFLSLRLRGVIHPIPDYPAPPPPSTSKKPANSGHKGKGKGKGKAEEEYKIDDEDTSLPGWQRIVMIMYKPTKRYLIQVLEYAEENFGDPFGPAISTLLTQNASGAGSSSNPPPPPPTTTADPNQTPAYDTAEAEAQLETYLNNKLLSKPEWRSVSAMDRATIEDMENRFRAAYALDWLDMEYAYAYEGVIIPGGKIMLGRWWRCGLLGEGPGKELDPDGGPVEPSDDEGEGGAAMDVDVDGGAGPSSSSQTANANANANTARPPDVSNGLERGPFVFWC